MKLFPFCCSLDGTPKTFFPFSALWNSNTKEEKRALAGEREKEGEEKNLLLYYG